MNIISRNAHWFLRLILVSVFLFHGLTKFPNFESISQAMNLPIYLTILVAILETVGAIFIFMGAFFAPSFTRIGILMLIPVTVGAIFIHWGQWSFSPSESHPMGGIEFPVTLLLIQFYLLVKPNKKQIIL